MPLIPPASAKVLTGPFQVLHAIHEDGSIALEVVGQQDPRRRVGQLDHRNASAHAVDREDEPATKDVREVGHVRRHVAAGHVDVVEPVEHDGRVRLDRSGQIGGGCQPPELASTMRAAANATSSRHGAATNWTPIGSPSADDPPRTTTAGQPVRLWMSL